MDETRDEERGQCQCGHTESAHVGGRGGCMAQLQVIPKATNEWYPCGCVAFVPNTFPSEMYDLEPGVPSEAPPESGQEGREEPTYWPDVLTRYVPVYAGDGGYWLAWWKQWPESGVKADGQTRDEAVDNLMSATGDYFGAMRARPSVPGEPSPSVEETLAARGQDGRGDNPVSGRAGTAPDKPGTSAGGTPPPAPASGEATEREGRDGLDRLAHALYGRDAIAAEWLGGSQAKILHDAADRILAALRAPTPEAAPAPYTPGPEGSDAPDRETLLRWAKWMRANPWRGMMARVQEGESWWHPSDFLEAVARELNSDDFDKVAARPPRERQGEEWYAVVAVRDVEDTPGRCPYDWRSPVMRWEGAERERVRLQAAYPDHGFSVVQVEPVGGPRTEEEA